ncbi:alpha/beta fold hydrolase [Pelagicoccus sp. SDUM812005]|uniref:esterase/lipase family protein n=1 Tax=Pelagicoccus sp. SDUM812005 TaxID=3041257 RepID=UPI00280E22C4|nr:alpha/beta fold hydrolase [Pelagicoccus sp. SDUM812005]MDQ8182885.1 alpha/beta fold hydrolase [Pelagicoccus sp. SDUM812005]
MAESRGCECVVLLHGLCRTVRSMEPLRRIFETQGYAVENLDYPSTRQGVAEIAEGLRPQLLALAERFERLHFVTHSMGGIVLRQLQAKGPLPKLGRCVMLAPPSQGSHVVDRLGAWPAFGWLNGPAGRELGTGPGCLPATLGPVDFEVGVLAGTRSINLILSQLLPKPNDGKVAVSHAQLAGQKAFRALPASHPFIMRNREVQENALAFVRTGAFLAE